MSDLLKEYRIVVCIDTVAHSAEAAYSKVYDTMMKIEPAQSWESSDEWFEDGRVLALQEVEEARLRKLASS